MANDILNPFPAMILHSLIIVTSAYYLSSHRIKSPIAIAFGFLIGLGASLFWRNLSWTFDRLWVDLLSSPILEGRLFKQHFGIDDAILGFITFWLLPIVLSWLAISLGRIGIIQRILNLKKNAGKNET